MALSKLTYVNNVTVIPASNLNAIQDEIIANASSIGTNTTDIASAKSEVEDIRVGADGTTYANAGDAVRGQIEDVKNSVGNIDISTLFELGSANANSSGFTYSNNYERVRLKEGTTFHFHVGDVIGLTDYTNARFMYAWKRTDTGVYNSDGWFTANKTITQEGDYVIVIANRTDTEQSSPDALASLFFGYQAIAFDYINSTVDDIEHLQEVKFLTSMGYLANDGSIVMPNASSQEVFTNKISCAYGDTFKFRLIYPDHHASWVAYVLYDQNGEFISRNLLFDGQKVWQESTFKIENSNAKYIAFTYRTYGIADVSIYSSKIENSLYWDVEELKTKISTNIRSINHRGYPLAPENTLPAYKMSKRKGFDMVEADINFTSDSVPVLLHDDTINRTARNADGTTISSTINISDITYAQALNYDFGIWKNAIYAGTKIPRFSDFIVLCKNIALHPYIELKNGSQEEIEVVVSMVKNCGMLRNVTWISFEKTLLERVQSVDPKARLGLLASTVTSTIIDNALALKTDDNDVFVNSESRSSDDIILCKNADLPFETYVINSQATLETIDPYITGITSDWLIASEELYFLNIN